MTNIKFCNCASEDFIYWTIFYKIRRVILTILGFGSFKSLKIWGKAAFIDA